MCKYQIPLKIEITIEGKKDFFYLTPKYCWVNKKTGLEIIERGLAACHVILLRPAKKNKYYKNFFAKKI